MTGLRAWRPARAADGPYQARPGDIAALNEVFGSLDESRRAGVVELLRRLHDRFEQVIVITHIEDVREGLDRVVRVRYDAARGTSVVDQEDAAVAVPEGALADPFAAGVAAGVA